MKLQKNKNFIGFLLGLFLMISLFPISVLAQGMSQSIVIDIGGDKGYSEDILRDRTIQVWKLDYLTESDEQVNLLPELEKMDLGQLTEKYGEPVAQGVSDPDNDYKITLDLERGYYYARENKDSTRKEEIFSFIFSSPTKGGLVQPKWKFPGQTGVQLLKYETTPEGKRSPLAGVEFALYRAGSGTDQAQEVPVEKAGAFYTYKEGGSPIPLVTDSMGIIEVGNLPPGDYYFKETKALPGYALLKQDKTFTVLEGKMSEVAIENFKEGQGGGFQFLKHDPQKQPLQGAKFGVFVKDDKGQFRYVTINDQNLVLTSGADGKFSVTGLQYGTYYLIEITPPEGYAKIEQPMVFVVDKESSTKVMFIENKPDTPPPGVDTPPKKPGTPTTDSPAPPRVDSAPKGGTLPNTGDISIIIMTIAGLILIGIGRHLIREEEYN